jgi:hypothetical protein
MLTPLSAPKPLFTADDMEKTGLLICAAAFFLAVIFIAILGTDVP